MRQRLTAGFIQIVHWAKHQDDLEVFVNFEDYVTPKQLRELAEFLTNQLEEEAKKRESVPEL